MIQHLEEGEPEVFLAASEKRPIEIPRSIPEGFPTMGGELSMSAVEGRVGAMKSASQSENSRLSKTVNALHVNEQKTEISGNANDRFYDSPVGLFKTCEDADRAFRSGD